MKSPQRADGGFVEVQQPTKDVVSKIRNLKNEYRVTEPRAAATGWHTQGAIVKFYRHGAVACGIRSLPLSVLYSWFLESSPKAK